jgi:hypothetical protein
VSDTTTTPKWSAAQRRVIHTGGIDLVGVDEAGRPVVSGDVGIPQQRRTWAVLQSGDPADVKGKVTPIDVDAAVVANNIGTEDKGGVFTYEQPSTSTKSLALRAQMGRDIAAAHRRIAEHHVKVAERMEAESAQMDAGVDPFEGRWS